MNFNFMKVIFIYYKIKNLFKNNIRKVFFKLNSIIFISKLKFKNKIHILKNFFAFKMTNSLEFLLEKLNLIVVQIIHNKKNSMIQKANVLFKKI
jgi:hypothetical protein